MAYAHTSTSRTQDTRWDNRPSASRSGHAEHSGAIDYEYTDTRSVGAGASEGTDTAARIDHAATRIDHDDLDSFQVHERYVAARGFRNHEKVDVTRATVARPAHPLPAVRRTNIDYDQYLQPQTDRFMIFTAPERRRQRNSITLAILIALFVLLGVLFVILYQPAA